jgi:hypothetical protein
VLGHISSSAGAMISPLERNVTSNTSFSSPLPSSLQGLVMLAPLSPTLSGTCLSNNDLKNSIQISTSLFFSPTEDENMVLFGASFIHIVSVLDG